MENIIYDKTVYDGRPENISNRLEKEIKCYDFLDCLGVSYTRLDHMHADTIEACENVEKLLETKICKNLFLCNRQQTEFYLLLMDGDKPFKTKDLSKQINKSRLSFATAEAMMEYLNITPGSVSVLGLMFDKTKSVTLLIDKSVLEKETFGCHPCINTSSICFKTEELLNKILPALGIEPIIIELPRYEN